MIGLPHTLPVTCSKNPLNSKYNGLWAGVRDIKENLN